MGKSPFLILLLATVLSVPARAETVAGPGFTADEPMDIQAQELIYEEKLQIVTALGNVDIVQEGRRLQADKVVYDITNDKATAEGDVVLTDTNGDVHTADSIEMEEAFKEGLVKGLASVLKDGSRVTAAEGTRINAEKIVLRNAWYTPCTPCQADPSKEPDWNVEAEEVILDDVAHTVTYKNAKFKLFGQTVAYSPYLSHPDGTVKQKSGFLPPRWGFNSQVGGFVESKYYHALAPDKDATTGVIVTGREGLVALGEYRQRYENAEMSIGGSITESTRPLEDNGDPGRSNKSVRGNLTGEGRWDMDNKWRSGYRINLASDDQYLRQYKLPRDDVLENEVYAERFDERDYTSIRSMAFQDTRLSRDNINQPHVVPWVEMEKFSEPEAVLGGRVKVKGSTVGLVRDGSGQDMQRFTGEGEWNKRTVLPLGIVNDTDAVLRGDLYRTTDMDNALPGQTDSDTSTRNFAQVHSQFGYPLAKRMGEGSTIIEPRVALTWGKDIRDLNDIPNEDSQDVDFSIAQLFDANRFAGYDRIDDGSRVAYGLSTQYVADNGRSGEVFLGQSRRISTDDTPFPDGSGLEDRNSDYVGRVRLLGNGGSAFEYGFRYDQESLAAERHDVTFNYVANPFSVAATYFYLAPLAGTDLTEDREQLLISPSWRIGEQWMLRGNARYDLSGDADSNLSNRGLQTAGIGFDYFGDCIDFSTTLNVNNLDEAAGTSETELFFRIGFKNLAEFETSPISFGERTDQDVEGSVTR